MGQASPAVEAVQFAENEHPIEELVSSIKNSTNPEFGLNVPITNKIKAFIVTSGSHIKIESQRLYIPSKMTKDKVAERLIEFGLAH